jgi:hypothetical protein
MNNRRSINNIKSKKNLMTINLRILIYFKLKNLKIIYKLPIYNNHKKLTILVLVKLKNLRKLHLIPMKNKLLSYNHPFYNKVNNIFNQFLLYKVQTKIKINNFKTKIKINNKNKIY